jgi:hypothetical protein
MWQSSTANWSTEKNQTFFTSGTTETSLKHSSPGFHQQPLVFMAYDADQKLCIVTYLQEYLKRTSHVRGDNKQLLIDFVKPYKPISTETNSHWIKTS